jgi:Ca2+/Na+ antiporter
MLDFSSYPLWINAAVFIAAAAAVWWAGTRLTRYADAISEMTGLGEALVGMLLLGGITSLPEIAVSVTAGVTGSAGLAVSNILGGVALQVVVIAIGDGMLRGHAITFQVARPAVLLQAVFSCLLLCLIVAAVVTAVLIRRYMMAFADIFGTNIFDLMLIFVIDVAYGGPAVVNEQGSFGAFGAVLGIVVTLIYVAGLIERRNRTFLRLGIDSWAVLGTYLAGVGVLWYLS